MRSTVENRSGRYHRLQSAIRLLAGAAAFLSACESQPTSPVLNHEAEPPATEFALTPDGLAAAGTAKLVGMHKLATVSRRSSEVQFSGAPPTINSPFDLTYFGGKVVKGATSHNIYVNCTAVVARCWGTGSLSPYTFLRDLNRSDFIRLANEYIGADAREHFPVGRSLSTSVEFTNHTASLDNILQILFDASSTIGESGYSAIYHVFLTEGTNMCFDAQTCYSPDNPATWVFCAFHGSVDFGSRHILFSVEPFQGVDGCAFPGQTPHGLIDATASTLSHEMIETITDPDGDGWWNALTGNETADLCFAFGTNQLLNGNNYVIQSEYSNKAHNCTNQVT